LSRERANRSLSERPKRVAEALGSVDLAGSNARAGNGRIPTALRGYLIACWISIIGVVELSSTKSSSSSGTGSRDESSGARVLLRRSLASNVDGIIFSACMGGQERGKEVEGSMIGATWVDRSRTREQYVVRHSLIAIKY